MTNELGGYLDEWFSVKKKSGDRKKKKTIHSTVCVSPLIPGAQRIIISHDLAATLGL
jgi:hypothetical protein